MLATQSMSAQSSNLAVRHLPFGLIWPDFISTSGLSIATKRAFQPDGKRQKLLSILTAESMVKTRGRSHSHLNVKNSPMKHLSMHWQNLSYKMIRCDQTNFFSSFTHANICRPLMCWSRNGSRAFSWCYAKTFRSPTFPAEQPCATGFTSYWIIIWIFSNALYGYVWLISNWLLLISPQ